MTGSNDDTTVVPLDVQQVACDGGDLGHPKVFYTFKGNQPIACGYCGHRFIKNQDDNAKQH